MTPCEEKGYKVGDEFEVIGDHVGFKSGQVVTLYRDDGTGSPVFAGDNSIFALAGGAPGAYMWIGHVRKIEKKPLTEQLRYAITKRDKQAAKAKRHAEKLEQREADVQRLIGGLEREIEEATGLPCSIGGLQISGTVEERRTIPDGVDVDDPMTWQEGDIIECVHAGNSNRVTPGKSYVFKSTNSLDNVRVKKDDCGQEWGIHNSSKFRFARRPS